MSMCPASKRGEQLPPDCAFLPISGGSLLVSRRHAVFCPLPQEHVDVVRAVVRGEASLDALTPPVRDDLKRHGFFDSPCQPKPDSPSVQLQLTNACNLACSYCCTNSGAPRSPEVRFDQLLRVVRQIPPLLGGDTRVALLGGEPLLVPWSLDLASEVVRLGLSMTIFTNGLPLTDDDLADKTARLIAQGAEVRVSMGGPSAETCSAGRSSHCYAVGNTSAGGSDRSGAGRMGRRPGVRRGG